MHKLPGLALLIALSTPTFSPLGAMAVDSDHNHRLSRPSVDDRPGAPSSIDHNGTTLSTEQEEATAAVNADELKAKIESWRKEAAAQDAARGPSPGNQAESQANQSYQPSDSQSVQATPKRVLQGSIDQYGEAKQQAFNIDLGIVARREFETAFPAKIFQVMPGSKASTVNVREGDRILKETLDKDLVHLTIKRAQKTFEVSINTGGAKLFDLGADQTTLKAGTGHTTLQAGASKSSLSAGTTAVKLKANVVEQMRDHDVVLIIDMSGSMTTREPQLMNLSRWDWVGRQSNELAMAAQQASSDLSVMLFASQFQVMDHVSPSLIPFIFQNVSPGGGTTLGAPLDVALSRYFAARQANPNVKPLIIAIITDGFPGDYGMVRQVLINAEHATRKDGEISVTFLLIGGEITGNRRMEELDSQLGAPRDIVNLVEFNQVLQLGVSKALSEALSGRVMRNAPLSAPTSSPFGYGGLLGGHSIFPGQGMPGMTGMPGMPVMPLNNFPAHPYQPNAGVRNYP